MNKQFTVFSAHTKPVDVVANLPDGSPVTASVQSFEVQLVSSDPNDGTIKLSFMGNEAITEAMALFVQDSIVTATFTAGA